DRAAVAVVLLVSCAAAAIGAMGQLTERPLARALTHPAIEYASRPTADPVVELNRRLAEGTARLPLAEETGHLRPVPEARDVPGTHGSMRHLGNAIVHAGETPDTIVLDRTLNRTSIDGFDAHGYLSRQSDIAALMVFEHQSYMTNLITRVGWEARIAAAEQRLDPAAGPMQEAIGELVDYALFADEQPLTARVRGTSGFAQKFEALGPADRAGRSLRQLD